MIEEGESPGLKMVESYGGVKFFISPEPEKPSTTAEDIGVSPFMLLGQEIQEIRTNFDSGLPDRVVIMCKSGHIIEINGEKLSLHFAKP